MLGGADSLGHGVSLAATAPVRPFTSRRIGASHVDPSAVAPLRGHHRFPFRPSRSFPAQHRPPPAPRRRGAPGGRGDRKGHGLNPSPAPPPIPAFSFKKKKNS